MPATLELSTETTHDQIQQYVDQVVEDVAADRAGDDATDAQRIAAERDQPLGDHTAVETSGSEVDTAGDGDDASKVTGQDWLDDDLKAEIAAYGISETELADFTSRDELERALRIFDRTALDAGRKALADSEAPKAEEKTGRARGEDGQFLPKEGKAGQYEIGLDKDLFDEDLIGEFEKLRDHYESRLERLEARFAEEAARAEEQQFDTLVDSLGHADLFGVTGKEDPKQLQRRQDLIVAVKAQQIGLQQLGRSVDLDESLVSRVARMVFAEDFTKKDLKSRTRKMQAQSNKRMGGGATKPSGPEESLREEMRRKYKELESA